MGEVQGSTCPVAEASYLQAVQPVAAELLAAQKGSYQEHRQATRTEVVAHPACCRLGQEEGVDMTDTPAGPEALAVAAAAGADGAAEEAAEGQDPAGRLPPERIHCNAAPCHLELPWPAAGVVVAAAAAVAAAAPAAAGEATVASAAVHMGAVRPGIVRAAEEAQQEHQQVCQAERTGCQDILVERDTVGEFERDTG